MALPGLCYIYVCALVAVFSGVLDAVWLCMMVARCVRASASARALIAVICTCCIVVCVFAAVFLDTAVHGCVNCCS